jgi:hypothetical protein
MSKKVGGGPQSRNVKQVPVRTGGAAKGINPGWAGQRGEAQGNHTMRGPTNYRGEPVVTSMPAGGDQRLGNAVAASTVCGPGGSRSVMATGSQQQHGMPEGRAAPQGRDILSDFGPEEGGR